MATTTIAKAETKVPLLARFKKPEDTDPKPVIKRVSVFQLWRYASKTDLILLTIGASVAIMTGFGLPYLAIIIGSMSESFVNATLATEFYYLPVNTTDGWRFIGDIYTLDGFKAAAIHRVVQSVYIGAIMFTSATIQVYCFLIVCENMMDRLRKAFFKAVMRQDIPWYDKNQTGSLATKLFDDLERIREGTGDKVALAIQYSAQFFGGFIVAFTYDWLLTLIMMSLTPLLAICGSFLAKLMAKSSAIEAKKYAQAGAIAQESISSVRTVYAFNGQEVEIKRYESELAKARWDGIKRSVYIGVGLGTTFLVLFSSYFLAFWVGTNFVVDHGMHPEIMITVFFSVMMGSMALGTASPQFALIGTAMGCAYSIYDVIDREPEIDSFSKDGETPENIEGHVEFKDVSFAYPTRPEINVLSHLDLEIKPGQVVAIVGSSGCGKSTICSLLLRYYNPKSGLITIDGKPIDSLNIKYLRKSIGVVSQEPVLFNLTIRENIQYGHDQPITEEQMREAAKKANAAQFIERLPGGYDTVVGERGIQLSGGQKQRIAIARALISSPKLLILDEATSALDSENEAIVQEALNKATKDVTTLIVAHRLSTIRNVDRIFVLQEGNVVESGRHEELMQLQGHYYNLVNTQVFADTVDEEIDGFAAAGVRKRRIHSTKSASSTASSEAVGNKSSARSRLLSQNSIAAAENGDLAAAIASDSSPKDPESEKKRLIKEAREEGAEPKNLVEILRYARPEWLMIFGGIVCCCIGGAVFPTFSMFFSNMLEVFAEPDPETKRKRGHNWALMFLVLGGIQGACMFLHSIFFGASAERLTKRLRCALFKHIFSMHIGYFDEPSHSTGKLCTRLASDCPNVKAAIDYRLGSVFSSAVSVIFGVILAFYYNWRMAILVVTIFPLGGVGHYFHMRFIRGRSKDDANEFENAGKVAMEAIDNVRTVQALTLEQRFYDRFSEHLLRPYQTYKFRAIFQALSYGFASSIFYFLHAAAFGFGVYLIMNEGAKPMSVLRTLFAISFTAGSMGYASAYFPEYAKARFAAGIIFKMLAERPQIDNVSKGGRKLEQVDGQITFKGVNFHYPQRKQVEVLRDFNLEIQPGQSVAIVGGSGCGKSTVISLLERFYDPDAGSVQLDSVDLREMSGQEIRNHMALVSQEPILFDRSIRENITYGMKPGTYTEEDIIEATRLANIYNAIEEFPEKFETRVGDKGVQLSGGQKQRIAISRALIRKPKILLLDEATSALDANSEQIVQEALDRACQGRTSIIIAHRLSTIINCNCIAVVKNGVIVEKGTHAELLSKRGIYYELTEKQNIKKT